MCSRSTHCIYSLSVAGHFGGSSSEPFGFLKCFNLSLSAGTCTRQLPVPMYWGIMISVNETWRSPFALMVVLHTVFPSTHRWIEVSSNLSGTSTQGLICMHIIMFKKFRSLYLQNMMKLTSSLGQEWTSVGWRKDFTSTQLLSGRTASSTPIPVVAEKGVDLRLDRRFRSSGLRIKS